MEVNFMAAKKSRRIGRIGKAAKKPSKTPSGPPTDSAPKSSSITTSQRTSMIPTKETRTHTEPRSCKSTRIQKRIERTTGHPEIRARNPLGFQRFEGSIQTYILPFRRSAELL